MKIGIDARFYGTIGKGLGRYTEKLIAALERLDRENEYVVFLRRENFDAYRPAWPNFRKVLADYPWYSLSEQIGFVRLLYRERLDLVHFPHFNVPLLYRRPFVVTVHDLILLHYPTPRASTHSRLWYWLKFFVYRQVIRSALRRARTVLTVSEFTKRDLLENYRFLCPGKIVVAYQAAEDSCPWRSPDTVREQLAGFGLLSAGHVSRGSGFRDIIRPYMLYVGNAYPHKNLEALVRATEGMSRTPDIRLVLVGRDDYFYRRLKAFVNRRGRTGGARIIFSGGVDDATLTTLYRFARAYVFPSLYEGFGLPPLEAMAVGTPVAASDRTSIPEILGQAALYFDPEDIDGMRGTIAQALADEGLRTRLRDAGYSRVKGYSWKTLAERTLAVYRGTAS